MSAAQSGLRSYRVPALMALASLIGLIGALIGDGLFDAVSWLAFGAIMITVVWAFVFRRKRAQA